MVSSSTVGARLDRLPIAGFHRQVLWLIGAGLFFDGFDIYLAGGVLGVLVKLGWSNIHLNAEFISVTFFGLLVGAWFAGVLGDRYGRRFTYQANLLIFGLASLLAVLAPSMGVLIALRFIMGVGLGAEVVVGYATFVEFIPPSVRGRWLAMLALITNTALFASALVAYIVIPTLGWRWMFAIAGVGALIVWYLRRALPESPRWLASVGRADAAERVMAAIEEEVAKEKPLPPVVTGPVAGAHVRPLSALFSRGLGVRLFVGSLLMVAMNTVLYGFVAWVPTFFVKEGLSVVSSLGFVMLMSIGGPAGCLIGMRYADALGRKSGIVLFSIVAAIIGALYPASHNVVVVTVLGFLLVTAIYTLVAFSFALYVPELFPTGLRLRGTGFCNTVGRMATILTPYAVASLFAAAGVRGVLTMLVAAVVVQAVVVALLGVETKQKGLEALAPEPAPDGAAATAMTPS